jgi:hypothetical protein
MGKDTPLYIVTAMSMSEMTCRQMFVLGAILLPSTHDLRVHAMIPPLLSLSKSCFLLTTLLFILILRRGFPERGHKLAKTSSACRPAYYNTSSHRPWGFNGPSSETHIKETLRILESLCCRFQLMGSLHPKFCEW